MKLAPALLTALVLAGTSALPARADFLNGGFQTTNFIGWTLEYGAFASGVWTWAAVPPLGHPVPAVINAGSALAPGQDFDVDPYCDSHMARINDLIGQTHGTRLRQETTLTTATANCSTLSVTWGAMLQDGHHTTGGQPEFTIEVLVDGVSASLTSVDTNAALVMGSGWTMVSPGVWYKTATTEISISGETAGDVVEVILSAYDCQFGGHGGMAFLDCVKLWPCPSTDTFCQGDGGPTTTPCPCANPGLFGCASAVNPDGGRLSGSGVATLSADTFVLDGSGMPNGPALYFQGTTRQNGGAGTVFGDGLLCVGGTLSRLGVKFNAAGASQFPSGSDASLSTHVAVPGIRTYQIWYRDSANFCTASTFNLSNGLEVTWSP